MCIVQFSFVRVNYVCIVIMGYVFFYRKSFCVYKCSCLHDGMLLWALRGICGLMESVLSRGISICVVSLVRETKIHQRLALLS